MKANNESTMKCIILDMTGKLLKKTHKYFHIYVYLYNIFSRISIFFHFDVFKINLIKLKLFLNNFFMHYW